jgi:hypothetical protein
MLMRLGAAFGLAATGLAVTSGAGAASPATDDGPAEPGAFGRPVAGERPNKQQLNVQGGGVTSARPGMVSRPEAVSAPGARLQPNTSFIDHTPLSRRTGSGTAWKVEG